MQRSTLRPSNNVFVRNVALWAVLSLLPELAWEFAHVRLYTLWSNPDRWYVARGFESSPRSAEAARPTAIVSDCDTEASDEGRLCADVREMFKRGQARGPRMNGKAILIPCVSLITTLSSLAWSDYARGAGDAVRGATIFQACAACHSTTTGEHMTGPSLAKIWQRKAGTVDGFSRYSEAMKHVDLVWNEETLDRWLSNPEGLIPGTSMTFPGLRESKARQDVIGYLKAVSEGKAPAQPQTGGMMMNMRPTKEDLKKAPPQGQVIGITHCGDAYTVTTADGKINKVWEFNLRFKTDSSTLGPRPGKPVIVGAGMQGDRASIVFARPSEISEFIHSECAEQK